MTENLIEAIRSAVAEGASSDARAAGANACRTLLLALEPQAGEPIAAHAPPGQQPDLPIGSIVAAIRGMPVDQLADLLIAKLRTLVPPDAAGAAPARMFNIQHVKVPKP